MNTKFLAIATVLAASLATAAHADSSTFVVTGPTTTSGITYYTYTVSDPKPIASLTFTFTGAPAPVSYYQQFSSSGLAPTVSFANPGFSIFVFSNNGTPLPSGQNYAFSSPIGSVGATELAAAPEPNGVVALSVLFGCLAVGVAAKRRRAAAGAL